MSDPHYFKVAVFFSNPGDSQRLRLDQEHRAIQQIIEKLKIPAETFHRFHATSTKDIIEILSNTEYDIVQFSGHGSQEGIFLESSTSQGGTMVTVSQLSALLKATSKHLKLLVLNSCFSSSSVPSLIDFAQYLITIGGEANDEAAIQFSSTFYELLFLHGSIERAFGVAQQVASGLSAEKINCVLSRRITYKAQERIMTRVFPGMKGFDDPIYVDITQVESQVPKLSISRDRFLSLLSRKIIIHWWIFDFPRDRTFLNVGPYLGEFSWSEPNDVVVCHRLLRMKKNCSDKQAELLTSLLLNYNDLFGAAYRRITQPFQVSLEPDLKKALDSYYSVYRLYFEKAEDSDALRELVEQQFVASKALIISSLRQCDAKFAQGDIPETFKYLEMILSSLHDLVDAVVSAVTE